MDLKVEEEEKQEESGGVPGLTTMSPFCQWKRDAPISCDDEDKTFANHLQDFCSVGTHGGAVQNFKWECKRRCGLYAQNDNTVLTQCLEDVDKYPICGCGTLKAVHDAFRHKSSAPQEHTVRVNEQIELKK